MRPIIFFVIDYKIWTDPLITARRSDLVLLNKQTNKQTIENLRSCRFCCSDGPQSERKRKRKDRKIPGFCPRPKKEAVDH